METKIIGLAGPARVGKSYLSRELKKVTGCEVMSFASSIRMALYTMGLNVDLQDKEAPIYRDKSTRDLMRSLGTAWGRESVHENLWVDLIMALIERSESHLVVIDDVRFANESTAIRNRGGFVVELSRGDIAYNREHPTEVGLGSEFVDMHVDTSNTLASVYEILEYTNDEK